jgi:hypothetical protein
MFAEALTNFRLERAGGQRARAAARGEVRGARRLDAVDQRMISG